MKLNLRLIGNFFIILSLFGFIFTYWPIISFYIHNPELKPPNPNESVIQIPQIKASSKIIDDVSPFEKSQYEEALQKGVARFGNLYFAHSSLPPWEMTRTNTPFLFLDKLVVGDEILIFENNEKKIFRIYDKKIIYPDNLSDIQKLEADNKRLILMTCTPLGTDFKRLLIFADLVE